MKEYVLGGLLFFLVIPLACLPQAGITCVITSLSRESEKSNSLAARAGFSFSALSCKQACIDHIK